MLSVQSHWMYLEHGHVGQIPLKKANKIREHWVKSCRNLPKQLGEQQMRNTDGRRTYLSSVAPSVSIF